MPSGEEKINCVISDTFLIENADPTLFEILRRNTPIEEATNLA